MNKTNMKIKLDSQLGMVNNDGTFNQKEALKNAGVKAAVCFKNPKEGEVIAPWSIRDEEDDNKLILRGLNTIYSDHTTPTEHVNVGLEITGIPKILCMVLNNEHEYTTCERSLRYTEIEPNDTISELEVYNYNKWLKIFEELIAKKYWEFYRGLNRDDKTTKNAIKKLAQENARYQVSVFMPTTLTYTAPFIQLNKVASYMEKLIKNPKDELEELLIPYMQDFINQLKELKVLLTKNDVYNICDTEMFNKLSKNNGINPENYKDNNDLVYKNNKQTELSLFANRNTFSGINLNNQYGPSISFNHDISFAALAQEHRHRTADFEMKIPDEFKSFIPPIIANDDVLSYQWINDMIECKNKYPQGQIVKVNMNGTLKNILNFIAKERACDRAQQEIEHLYTSIIIPEIYKGLVEADQFELADKVKPYVKKLRCQYPTYKCPNPCGHPRIDREL